MIADLVYEITATSGTGPLTLGGARSADFRTFASAHSIGDKVFYCVRGGGQWEVGQGTLTSATVLARTTVYNGSAGAGVAVNFAAGNKELYETPNSGSFLDLGALPASTTLPDTAKLVMILGDGSMQTVLGSIVKASGTGGAPADTTGPTLSSPTGASTGTTTASGSVTTNEGNGTLYHLATVNATETVATVKASGGTQAVSSTGSKTVNVTGLTASTQYYMHFAQTDAAGNDSARVTSSSFTTSAAGDTTAPTLSSPTGTQTGQTTATGTVSTNEANGTLYRYVSTNAVESAATVKAANLTQAVTATGVQNVSATGLTAATTYYWHFVHRDAADNDSTVSNSAAFTTATVSDGYTYTRLGGGGQTSTLQGQAVSRGSSNSGTYPNGSGVQYISFSGTIGINEEYFGVSPIPPGAVYLGWGPSNTVAPPVVTTGTTSNEAKTDAGAMYPATEGSTSGSIRYFILSGGMYMWVRDTVGTTNHYLWIKPADGNAYCLNPSSPCVVTLA